MIIRVEKFNINSNQRISHVQVNSISHVQVKVKKTLIQEYPPVGSSDPHEINSVRVKRDEVAQSTNSTAILIDVRGAVQFDFHTTFTRSQL